MDQSPHFPDRLQRSMRVAILVASGCFALIFAVSFGLTFFAKEYITGLAQDFVTDKTLRFADPAVEVAEQALRAPGINQVLDAEAIQTAHQEIADYRRDPRSYIAQLVTGKRPPAPAAVAGQDGILKERVLRWKVKLREHFDHILDRLMRDLRIFCGSNLVAALIAAWCAFQAKGQRVNWLLGVAGLLLVSVVYMGYMYVDGLTYFRILFNTHIGWWYPVLLTITFIGLYREYGHRS